MLGREKAGDGRWAGPTGELDPPKGPPMPPETLPLLLATLAVYVTLGTGVLLRVRRRRRAEAARRLHGAG